MYPRSGFRPTRRDALVACFSAACMLVWFQLNPAVDFTNRSTASRHSWLSVPRGENHRIPPPPLFPPPARWPAPPDDFNDPPPFREVHPYTTQRMPSTKIIGHSPGWTIFDNLYMHNGTLLIISDDPVSTFPERRLMTSTGQCSQYPIPQKIHVLHSYFLRITRI